MFMGIHEYLTGCRSHVVMTNFKLNRMSISILGAFFAPVLVASGSVPYEGFSQEASGTDADGNTIDETYSRN